MQITQRDKEIMGFVLAMKFATAQDIHQKFFRKKRDGTFSNSEWWTRERLRELVEYGYLSTTRYRFEQKNYFIGTKHAYDFLEYMQYEIVPTKPIPHIDVRTFDHDIAVMKSRLLIEEVEKGCQWKSDRQLKCEYPAYFDRRSSRDACPDGVYRSVDGKLIAFEYEIAQKSKKRYQDKIRSYVSCIRSRLNTDPHGPQAFAPKYDFVRFICEKECVYKALKEASGVYRDYFSIELARDFFESRAEAREVNSTEPQALSAVVH